ncbi:helix-turn-helix domain-containing protein [Azospirillum sp. B4]|uniref:winged helix-turn-helix transcriptional regulator n=1 Tax=Azospirillum sp. B4 TaxID=95605 RepID=UPI0003456953|nr:helix-turn-helix domain-containing protein [Azospirillum sp. B4]
MHHNSPLNPQCPIGRSLERVGEWWTIHILREAFLGATRFDQFQKNLGIAPNMLTRRLNALVADGLLEKRPYSTRPLRHEYVLTAAGLDFRPVLWTIMAWGNKHFSPEGLAIQLVDSATGTPAEPQLIDRHSGRPLTWPAFRTVAGPAADARTKSRYPVWPATTPQPTSPTAGSADAADAA